MALVSARQSQQPRPDTVSAFMGLGVTEPSAAGVIRIGDVVESIIPGSRGKDDCVIQPGFGPVVVSASALPQRVT